MFDWSQFLSRTSNGDGNNRGIRRYGTSSEIPRIQLTEKNQERPRQQQSLQVIADKSCFLLVSYVCGAAAHR
jgi:hypothetical protein